MSWGERSCKRPCRCPDKCQYHTCNVDCPEYEWDGVTKPDSVTSKAPQDTPLFEPNELTVQNDNKAHHTTPTMPKLNRHERRRLEALRRKGLSCQR